MIARAARSVAFSVATAVGAGVSVGVGVALMASVSISTGCAHSASFNGRVFRKGPVAYEVGPIPSSWTQIEVSNANLAFRDEGKSASILVNGRCGSLDDDTPLRSLTQHLLIGTTEREFTSEQVEPFDGREALHVILRAKLDGVLMQYDIYVAKKNGCVYDFVYVAEPNAFEVGRGEFEQFVSGFRTLSKAEGE